MYPPRNWIGRQMWNRARAESEFRELSYVSLQSIIFLVNIQSEDFHEFR